MEYQHITHPFEPVYDAHSRILILGTLPSVKSREASFFYGHQQNRFWKLLAAVLRESLPQTVPEKKALLLRNGIALWDVIESCDICGSSDSSIRNVVPADLGRILSSGNITAIYTNGAKASALYRKYQESVTGIPAIPLPSTSPANAAWSLERLEEKWQVIREHNGMIRRG